MDTEEIAEEIKEAGERIVSVSPNPKLFPVAVGLVAFGAGVAIGYIIGKRRAGEVYVLPSRDERMEAYREQAAIYQGGGLVIPAEDHPSKDETTPLKTVGTPPEQRIPYHRAAGGEEVEIVTETRTTIEPLPDEVIDAAAARHADTVRQTIFAGMTDDWDLEAEKAQRTKTEPYIIHVDEFEEDSMGFIQLPCTYYEKDDVVVADNDPLNPFPNYPRVLGELRFGHGSKDPNVVYIRNEARRTEYEVVLDKGSHEEEVLNLHEEREDARTELRHERTRRFPRD